MADTRDTTTKCRGDRFITKDGGRTGVMCPGCEKCKHLKPMRRLPDEPSDTTTPDLMPRVGDAFDDNGVMRKVIKVGGHYDTGGAEVLLDDGVWYDGHRYSDGIVRYFAPEEAP